MRWDAFTSLFLEEVLCLVFRLIPILYVSYSPLEKRKLAVQLEQLAIFMPNAFDTAIFHGRKQTSLFSGSLSEVVKVNLVKTLVKTGPGKQLFVPAHVYNLSVIHDNDPVC